MEQDAESQGRNIWDKRRLLVVLFLILVDASCIFPLRVHLVLCSSLKDELKVKPLDSWPVDSLGLASDLLHSFYKETVQRWTSLFPFMG